VILLFGGNGQLGRELVRAAAERATPLLALSHADVDIADGAMAPMSKGLSEREIDAIAAYLTPAPTVAVARQSAACPWRRSGAEAIPAPRPDPALQTCRG